MSHCPLESHGGLHISIHLLSLISTICAMVLTDMCHAVDRMQYTLRDTLPSFAKVVWKSLEDSRGKRRDSESCMINVCIAVGLSQKASCLSLALPSVHGSLCCIAMADRSSFEETSRRLAAERERLQAIARRNEEKAKERMRLKQEAASAAEQAKGAAERTAKAAGMACPKGEDLVIKPTTRPPPGVSLGKRRGTSPAAIPQKPMPSPKGAMSPCPPAYPPPLASGSAWETPPPTRSPSEEHVSMFGDTPDTAAPKAKGSGELKSALAGESSQRRGPPKVAFVAEAVIIPIR